VLDLVSADEQEVTNWMPALSSYSRIRLQACGSLNALVGLELGRVVVQGTLEEVATFKRCVRSAILS
jgi:hypothetical protein